MNYFSFIADFIFFSVGQPPTVPVTNFFTTCASVLHQNVKNRSRLDGGLLPFLYTPIQLQKSHLDKRDVCSDIDIILAIDVSLAEFFAFK